MATETTDLAALGTELKDFTSKATGTLAEQSERLLAIEQKLTAPGGGPSGNREGKSLGEQVAESEQFKFMLKNNGAKSGRIPVTGLKTTIVNATGQNQPLVPAYRVPGIIPPGQRRLTVRDLVPTLPTTSNMIEFVKETSSTNNAGVQAAEGDPKGESALAFTLSYQPVKTLAHWIPASRQVMEDSASLAAYIDTRLMYMLKLKEESQLLFGPDLAGLYSSATAYDTSYSVTATDTYIDTIKHAITQVNENSDFEADGIVLNSLDWATIQLVKTTGTASSGEYIFADPHSVMGPRLWGLPVVATKSMTRGEFLVGAFQMAAAIWDRDTATIELSREHESFFIKNLVAVLVEERLSQTIFRADALVRGGFPFGS
jgi:HK97 family phage major capsid protein